MFSLTIDILCMFWWALECVKNLTHCLHRVEHSPLVAAATICVIQNVTPYWEELLCVNTISNMIRIYTLKIKTNISCVAD
jgi:hypothetical protein